MVVTNRLHLTLIVTGGLCINLVSVSWEDLKKTLLTLGTRGLIMHLLKSEVLISLPRV